MFILVFVNFDVCDIVVSVFWDVGVDFFYIDGDSGVFIKGVSVEIGGGCFVLFIFLVSDLMVDIYVNM